MADLTLTEALRRLHAAGRIKSRWLPGMLFVDSVGRTARRTGFRAPEATLVGHRTMEASQAQPVLTDPATCGCLLALLREASGSPELHVSTAEGLPLPADGRRWTCWSLDRNDLWSSSLLWMGHTEGEALAAALIALAEGLP